MKADRTPWRVWLRERGLGGGPPVLAARNVVSHLKPAVVVTGGSRGIGLAIARRFAMAGRHVAIVARNPQNLASAAAEIKSATAIDIAIVVCDVTELQAFDLISKRLSTAGLYLDVLVNNAGMGLAGEFISRTPDEISRLIALNIESVTRLTRAALPQMIARRQGGILNVASLGGEVPGPNQAAHYASKSYVVSLSEALASEVASQGVRVCALLPGPVSTGFHRDMGAERSLYRYIIPSMSPERVARSAYFGFMLGKRVIVPGLFNNLMYLSLKVFPHVVTVPVVYWLLKRPKT